MRTPREELRPAIAGEEVRKKEKKQSKKNRQHKVNDIMSSHSKNALSSDIKSSYSGSQQVPMGADRLFQGLGVSS